MVKHKMDPTTFLSLPTQHPLRCNTLILFRCHTQEPRRPELTTLHWRQDHPIHLTNICLVIKAPTLRQALRRDWGTSVSSADQISVLGAHLSWGRKMINTADRLRQAHRRKLKQDTGMGQGVEGWGRVGGRAVETYRCHST